MFISLLSESQYGTFADALKSLKQAYRAGLVGEAEHFWQKRYYDFNIWNHQAVCGEAALDHFPVGANQEKMLVVSGRKAGDTKRILDGTQPQENDLYSSQSSKASLM